MAKINEITITELLFQEGSAPSTPAATKWKPYFKTDGLYVMDDAGTEYGPLAASGGGGSALLDLTRFTSSVAVTATSEATADTVVTASAVVLDGSTGIDIEFYAPNVRPDTNLANQSLDFWLYDGSSSIGKVAAFVTPAAAADSKPAYFRVPLAAPSAASHTYSIRASVFSGTGRVFVGAGGNGNNFPGHIRITESPTA